MPSASSDPIHVAVLGLTGIAADIVRNTLATAEGIEIVGGRADQAKVAILGLGGDARTDTPDALLRRCPSLKVLAVERDGREASLFEMRPYSTELGELSPATLLEAVRKAAA